MSANLSSAKHIRPVLSMQAKNRSIILQIPHKIGALKDVLSVFSKHSVNLAKIESRPTKSIGPITPNSRFYDFFVDVDPETTKTNLEAAVQELLAIKAIVSLTHVGSNQVPWFPRKIAELDRFANQILEAGGELQSDHPGFNDAEYRKRRQMIAEIAINFRHGQRIPRVEYTKQEKDAWRVIYQKLLSMYPKFACSQVNYVFPLLQANCGYSETNIPQLEDISNFLKDTTGFRLRPVSGLLSSRDFLNGLAFRVFHSTQYLRHHSRPLYTPEPDIVHELMGHVPLFADHDFADFSQEIGLASLGASEEDVKKLATLYWFTVEFGICKQNGEHKAYGAGLLSSFGELEYAIASGKPDIRPLDPEKTCVQEYPITTYQPVYFAAESFERVKEQVRTFAASLSRPFAVRYNPLTESIEVLNDKRSVVSLAKSIQAKAALLQTAVNKMSLIGSSFEENELKE